MAHLHCLSKPSGPEAQSHSPLSHALTKAEQAIATLLERGLGLAPNAHLLAAFTKQCHLRAEALGIDDKAYIRLLKSDGPTAKVEWMAIAPSVVIGETFFYRDAPLWALIETTLLPSVARLSPRPNLWSAGCSTGEETYTLASVAHRVLGPNRSTVLGTDVNPKAVAAARVGVYGRWSLRGSDTGERSELIVTGTQTVRVREDVKSLVRFETHNLSDGSELPAGFRTFEFIVCRNVLIYMSYVSRAKVIKQFIDALRSGGVLILGHGESAGLPLEGLVIERHDAAIVYRKPLNQPAPKIETPARIKPLPQRKVVAIARHVPVDPVAAKAPKPLSSSEAAQRCREFVEATILSTRNGELEAAQRTATAAVEANPLDPEPHVLLGAISMARGGLREAERELRRALFLDPFFVPALWQVGNLYGLTGRKRQAAFAFARALARLEGLPTDAEALPFDNLTVGELAVLLRAELGERPGA